MRSWSDDDREGGSFGGDDEGSRATHLSPYASVW